MMLSCVEFLCVEYSTDQEESEIKKNKYNHISFHTVQVQSLYFFRQIKSFNENAFIYNLKSTEIFNFKLANIVYMKYVAFQTG